MVCINVPLTTAILSNATSDSAHSTYSKEQLVSAAQYTRDFSVGSIDEATLKNNLEQQGLNPSDLSDNMLSHLQDCTPIFNTTTIVFTILLIASLGVLLLVSLISGKRAAAIIMRQCGVATIILFALLFLWIAIDFRGLFIMMHKILFAQGNWTFEATSLLICMYPTNFWIGMAVVWVTISILLSAAMIVISVILNK